MSGDKQPESDTAKAITDLTEAVRLMNEEITSLKSSEATHDDNNLPPQQLGASVNAGYPGSCRLHSGERHRKHGRKTSDKDDKGHKEEVDVAGDDSETLFQIYDAGNAFLEAQKDGSSHT